MSDEKRIVFPISEEEVIRLGFTPPEKYEGRGYGVTLSAWDMKRGFARWLAEGQFNPLTHEQASEVVTNLRRQIVSAGEATQVELDAKNKEIQAHADTKAEVEKWQGKNSGRAKKIDELKQSLAEAQETVRQSQASVDAAETLVNGKDKEIGRKETQIEELERTINRYKEKYQSVDRPLSWLQRIVATTFKI